MKKQENVRDNSLTAIAHFPKKCLRDEEWLRSNWAMRYLRRNQKLQRSQGDPLQFVVHQVSPDTDVEYNILIL